MTKDEWKAEYARLRASAPPTNRFLEAPAPKGVTPEVVCPLCQGGRRLPAGPRGACVTTLPERKCVLCEGAGVIADRSHERPSAKGKL